MELLLLSAVVFAMIAFLTAVLSVALGLSDLRGISPGLFYATQTPEGVESAIRRAAMLDTAVRQKLADDYRHIALARFTAERGVNDYVALYADLAGRKPAGVAK